MDEPSKHPRGPIRRAELERETAGDMLAAVQRLRPGWLRIGRPRIYVGAASVGLPESLRDISPTSVERVEYVSPPRAMARYGRNHDGGVIVVHMRS